MLETAEREYTGQRNGAGMKRPLSPTEPEENGVQADRPATTLDSQRFKREKKQQTYTLCDVCNIQLNSPAQAQIHCNGKSHQKRLKQLNKGKPTSSPGTPSQSSPLLATLPVAGRPLQPQLDLKHFLPFRLNGSSPMSLFPNFNTNQAEAHYKGHKHARKLKAMEVHKNKQRNPNAGTSAGRGRDREREAEKGRRRDPPPALMETSSQEEEEEEKLTSQSASVEGKQEDRESSMPDLSPGPELPSLELTVSSSPLISPNSHLSESISEGSAMSRLDPGCEMGPTDARRGTVPSGEGDNGSSKKSKQHLHCPVCKVTVNSVSQLEAHNTGAKHKSMLEGQTSQPRRRSKVPSSRSLCKTKRIGNKGSMGVQSKAFHCEVCAIYVNSDTQLKQHMNSRRHKDRLAGKPPKPKYSPYNKSQQSTVLANVRWSSYAGSAVTAMKKVFSRYNLTSLSSQTKLALQKQLTKTLTPGFLPSPLSPAALCTMAASPLTLRHPAGTTTTTLIQTPLLGPALFRPAPGPLRAAHTPILFAPY
ncbi:zinc finger protein 385C isoform X2 [Polypterus senegalus]|uniref:zinc finger protein 385C isoform X2 n=1 Tax=Polypterus senegalus TaxID=55291 RepID=UPI001964FBA1|nr:zinc finger protein 385C isoform X2 [Polypterus senegalus]